MPSPATNSDVWDKLTQHKHFNGLKNATVAFLVFILLLSIVLIGVGAGGIQTLAGFDTILKVTVPAGVIVLGIFLLVSTILGLVGIYQKKGKVFAAYLFILFLLIICQFGVGGGAYTWSNQIPSQIENAWRFSLSDNDRNSVQQTFFCCGWWNSTDVPGSDCMNNHTLSTTGFFTTGATTVAVPTTAIPTTAVPTTAIPTTAAPTTAVPTTGAPTTAVPTTAVPTTGATSAATQTAQATTVQSAQSSSTNQAPGVHSTTALMKRQVGYMTESTMPLNVSNGACGPLVISACVTALNYVGAVEVAFSVLQLVGLLTGIALAIWILVQAGKQKFNRLGEEDPEAKFARQDYTGGGSHSKGGDDDDDDGMSDPAPHSQEPGKKKIVVNFDH